MNKIFLLFVKITEYCNFFSNSINRYLVCFQCFVIISNVVMNYVVHTHFCIAAFIQLQGKLPKVGCQS